MNGLNMSKKTTQYAVFWNHKHRYLSSTAVTDRNIDQIFDILMGSLNIWVTDLTFEKKYESRFFDPHEVKYVNEIIEYLCQ